MKKMCKCCHHPTDNYHHGRFYYCNMCVPVESVTMIESFVTGYSDKMECELTEWHCGGVACNHMKKLRSPLTYSDKGTRFGSRTRVLRKVGVADSN